MNLRQIFGPYFPRDERRRTITAQKLDAFERGGIGVVCTDFDWTLTTEDGVNSPLLPGYIDDPRFRTDAYIRWNREMFEQYWLSCGMDTSLPLAERSRTCDIWFEKIFALHRECGTSRHVLDDFLSRPETLELVDFRPGVFEFFSTCKQASIPILVFSAGLGDVIERVLAYKGTPKGEFLHIIANYFAFESDGSFRGQLRSSDVIHPYTKNEHHIEKHIGAGVVNLCGNIVLFGDAEGDAAMIENAPGRTVLRIGFLESGHSEDMRRAYEEAFDLVFRGPDIEAFSLCAEWMGKYAWKKRVEV